MSEDGTTDDVFKIPDTIHHGGLTRELAMIYTPYGYVPDCSSITGQSRTITSENYTPSVSISVVEENSWLGGTNRVTVTANANDVDGQITSYEWWIGDENGANLQKQNSTSNKLIFYSSTGGKKSIKIRVNDNGVVEYDSFGTNATGLPINSGTPYHFQSITKTIVVDILPWSCHSNCQLH
ncbi:hypothetical protein [Paraferrimonas haliotis]|uniref:hypothetical protein n=1 Tax=Paraferrimonas haliotis TaxID=2013866 RepID=UPI000F78CCB9|nr:hypothetical protein [Paraferrimonas haliotis]